MGEVCREFTWGPRSDPDIFAHACNVAGGTYQLFFSEGARLTHGPGAAGQPALSPVGWRLAFVSSTAGHEGLSLIDDLMEGQQPRRLVPKPGRIDRVPVWGPSGRSLAFVGHTGNSADLYLISDVARADATLVKLTDWAGDELNPSWSPDGRRIAFFASRRRTTGRHAGYDLYVFDLANKRGPFRVAQNVVLNEKRGPAWTPDGRHLIFVKNVQRRGEVDPIYAARAEPDADEIALATQTVSNQDPTVAVANGRWWLAYTSLGYRNAEKLTWRRVFRFSLPSLPR